MKRNLFQLTTSLFFAIVFSLVCPLLSSHSQALAQEGPFDRRAPSCTNGTASGTYGYHMSGEIPGMGSVLVNGIFTQNPDGTGSGRVWVNAAGQTIPDATWSTATFKTNNDCTGSGSFFFAPFNQNVTFDFVVTDGGKQIELVNTVPGNAFNGVGRRISPAGRAPSCNNGTVLGTYGYRLDGSIPNVPHISGAGIFTHALDAGFNGTVTGSDTYSFYGQILRRTLQGTYKVNTDCTGSGKYTDSLGNTISYVFVAVDNGREIYVQGTDPGAVVSGVGRRVQ